MSPTTTDDVLAADLRHRADSAAPPMSLDLDAVLEAGRRRHRRTVALRAGTGVIGTAAAGALVLTLVGGGQAAPELTAAATGAAPTVEDGPVWVSRQAVADPRGDAFGATVYDLGLSLPAGVLDSAAVEAVLVPRPTTHQLPGDEDPVAAVALDLRTVRDDRLDDPVFGTEVAREGSENGRSTVVLDEQHGHHVLLVTVRDPEGVVVELVATDGTVTTVPLLTVPETEGLGFGVVVTGPAAPDPAKVRVVGEDGLVWSVPVSVDALG